MTGVLVFVPFSATWSPRHSGSHVNINILVMVYRICNNYYSGAFENWKTDYRHVTFEMRRNMCIGHSWGAGASQPQIVPQMCGGTVDVIDTDILTPSVFSWVRVGLPYFDSHVQDYSL